MSEATPANARGDPGGALVELVDAAKVYPDFWGRPRVEALRGVSLQVHPGEVFALLGPNGAGKSTTIKLALGLLFPTRGRVAIFGGSPTDPAHRRRLGYLPEETRLPTSLSVAEVLELFARLHGFSGRERRERREQLTAMVGLAGAERRAVGELSKGMARRVGLAVALVGDPDLLVLDEPTSGLDPLGTREIKELILSLRDRGRTILLSSHLLDDVEDVADRIAILYGGELHRLGPTRELLTRPGELRVDLAGPQLEADAVAQRVRQALPEANSVRVTVATSRLERLFREVVAAAEAGQTETAGARTGGPLAAFLEGRTAGSPARGTPTPESPTPAAPAPAAPTPERLSRGPERPPRTARLAAEGELPPVDSEGGRKEQPAGGSLGPLGVLEGSQRAVEEAAPRRQPAEVPPTDNPVLSRLLGGSPASEPPRESAPPAPDEPERSRVLERLVAPAPSAPPPRAGEPAGEPPPAASRSPVIERLLPPDPQPDRAP